MIKNFFILFVVAVFALYLVDKYSDKPKINGSSVNESSSSDSVYTFSVIDEKPEISNFELKPGSFSRETIMDAYVKGVESINEVIVNDGDCPVRIIKFLKDRYDNARAEAYANAHPELVVDIDSIDSTFENFDDYNVLDSRRGIEVKGTRNVIAYFYDKNGNKVPAWEFGMGSKKALNYLNNLSDEARSLFNLRFPDMEIIFGKIHIDYLRLSCIKSDIKKIEIVTDKGSLFPLGNE